MRPASLWNLAPAPRDWKKVSRSSRGGNNLSCQNDIENEFHFMFYCPQYHVFRLRLFDKCNNPDLMWVDDSERLKWFTTVYGVL